MHLLAESQGKQCIFAIKNKNKQVRERAVRVNTLLVELIKFQLCDH